MSVFASAPVRSCMSTLAAGVTSLVGLVAATQIVHRALLRVAQNCKGCPNTFEGLVRTGHMALIRVQSKRQLAICLLEVRI
jgi:hypothetical protein